MNYKCIPYSEGVDVSINSSSYFTFKQATHVVIDLGNNRVRISRKIDGLIEFYNEPVSAFVDVDGLAVATNVADLTTYFNTYRGIKAGEGVSVNNGTVSVVAGGPSTLGGFKVGTGLSVDGSGRLSASATSEVTKVLATEAEMLALTTESLRSYRVIRLDTKRLYYLNPETTPSVLANWFVGPSIEATAVSFQGRSGAIVSEYGDYNFDLVPVIDKTTAVSHKLVIDAGKLYVENVTTSERVEIAYANDLGEVSTRLTAIEDIVTSQATGLVKKVADLSDTVVMVNDSVNNVSNGLITRVTALENATPGQGTDYTPQIEALQAKDVQQDVIIGQVDAKTDSVASNNVILDQRVTTLENRPAGTDYSTQITALQDKDTAQDTRLTTAEAQLLNKASLVAGKVPYEQLPEFPVGRKVNVANKAARLALSAYSDLTIAYQSDTGDAWGLDANADPAIDPNWSKLGNAQALGVSSFNGRTGNIGVMSGDYNTGQITEILDKRFVTPTQIEAWDAKETTTGAQTKATTAQTAAVSAAKTYADSTFINKSDRSVANGVAPLDSAGRLSSSYLYRGSTNGIAPLDANAKVPVANLPSGTANGVAPLDANGKVPVANLPTPPIWRNPTGRVVGTWYTNTTPNVMVLNLRTASSTATSRFLNVQTRANASGTAFHQRSTALSTTGERWIQLSASVPPGWQYMVDTFGGSTTANTEYWHEMS